MEPKAQPQNQQEIVHNANQVTNPTQTTQVLKEEKAPTVNATQPTAGKTSQESNDNKTVNNNTQNDKKVSNPGDQINNQNEQKEPKEPKKENTEVRKQPQQEKPTQLQNKGDTNQTAIKDQTQNSNNQKDVPRKESQSKAQPSKDKQKGNSATSSQNDIKADTQRSEAKKDTITQPKKKSSQDLKEKDAKEKKVDQVNNPKIVKEAGKENKQKPQEGQKKPEPTLGGAFGSILKFFTSTKDKVEGSSSQVISKLQEVVLQSKIVSTIAGTEPKKIETKEENQKPQKSRLNRNQGQKKPTKIETESSSKTLATESTKEKTLPPKESKITIRKAISKPKIAEGSGASPVRGKNEVEEQIRLHKIQEVKKMKKVLLEKLDALNNQLFELEKPGLDSHRDGESPVRVVFNLEEYKQKQKEELDQRKKEALEFAKKMNRERKELEHKREKRRDEQHALVIKDIDLLYQKQLDELASVKGGSAKAKFEENIKKFKQDNMFAALEEKKKNLKIMREFKKISGEDPTEKEDMNEGEQNNSEKKKVAKKPIYKSPVLAQVLKEDEALKKVETEKAQSKKDLYLKKLNYSKEVKSTYLPQVQASKYTFDPDGKIARAVNRSHNIEKHLVRNAGKDSLYNYLDKMRNKYPNISKPRKNSEDESEAEDHKHPVNKYGKEKNNKVKAKHRQEEEEDDYYGEEDMQNYELDDDVNLTDRADRAEVSRDSQSKPKGIKNLKSKSHQSGLKRKSVASDEELSEESGVAEKNFESHSKITKKHQVEQKGPKEEDDNEWEEELRNDQQVLKDKISNMLGDIKKIESQMKQKEKRLLEDMEKQKEVDP